MLLNLPIPQDVVENALSSESNDAVNVKKDESIVNKPIESLSTENVVAQSSEQGNVTEVKEEGLKETANNEILIFTHCSRWRRCN